MGTLVEDVPPHLTYTTIGLWIVSIPNTAGLLGYSWRDPGVSVRRPRRARYLRKPPDIVPTCHKSCRDASPWSDPNPQAHASPRDADDRYPQELDFGGLGCRHARSRVYTFKLYFVAIVNYLQLDTDIEKAVSEHSGLRVLAGRALKLEA